MPSIKVKEHEPFDIALRRFRRACEKAGIPGKLRQIEFYEKPTAERKRKRSAAVKRQRKQSSPRSYGVSRERSAGSRERT